MSSANPVRSGIAPFLAAMPETYRRVAAGLDDPSTLPAVELGSDRETETEAAHRRYLAATARRRDWTERLDARFAKASLTGLKPWQNPRGVVAAWWDSPSRGLALNGDPGHGKSWAVHAVGARAFDTGAWVLAYTAADLNAALRPGAEAEAGTYARVTSCDLLILDDLGREKLTDWTVEQLQRVVDARSRAVKRTAWTTNLGYQPLVDRYGHPIIGRLLDDAVAVEVKGNAMRAPAPWGSTR